MGRKSTVIKTKVEMMCGIREREGAISRTVFSTNKEVRKDISLVFSAGAFPVLENHRKMVVVYHGHDPIDFWSMSSATTGRSDKCRIDGSCAFSPTGDRSGWMQLPRLEI